MLKIVSVVGARPQFVKAAMVSREIAASGCAHEVMLHTGQHFDDNMSRVFFEELDIAKPSRNFGIGGSSQGKQTGRMIEAIEQALLEESPDWVLIYGDTNSTFAGGLAAAKLHIPVAHVEAGLRSYNRRMPEELNRVVADHVSSLLFAPTKMAIANLAKEGIMGEKVLLCGDVMYDAATYYGATCEVRTRIMQQLELSPRSFILATVHRAENTDDPQRLRRIFEGLNLIADKIPVVLPLHPRTADRLMVHGLSAVTSKIKIIDPVSYLSMLALLKNSALVVTDSGGVQKEAYFFRRPCITLRDETEWVELVENGWNELVSPQLESRVICKAVLRARNRIGCEVNLYGEGNASKLIVDALLGM